MLGICRGLRAASRVRAAAPLHAALRVSAPAAVPLKFHRGVQNSAVTDTSGEAAAPASTSRVSYQADKPTIEEAKRVPRHPYQMSQDVLQVLAGQGNAGARAERMIREIMVVDNVSWDEAQPRLQEMREFNHQYSFLETLPYKIGIAGATGFGFLTIPLCFNSSSVLWFNKEYVTMDLPPPEDLETWLEVGTFSWNWMEPPLGQIGFMLLCLQFSHAQMNNIGVRPFTSWIQDMKARNMVKKFDFGGGAIEASRAGKLVGRFSMYEPTVVEEFARSDSVLATSNPN